MWGLGDVFLGISVFCFGLCLMLAAVAVALLVRIWSGDCDLQLRAVVGPLDKNFWEGKVHMHACAPVTAPRTNDILCVQVVWVTGASSGIGLAYASEVASVAKVVVISTRRAEQLNAIAKENPRPWRQFTARGSAALHERFLSAFARP